MSEKYKDSEMHTILKGGSAFVEEYWRTCFRKLAIDRFSYRALRERRTHGLRGLLAMLGNGMRFSSRSRCDQCHRPG